MIFKKLLTIFLIFSLTNCVPNWYKPMGYRVFRKMPKEGSPGFKLGWIHGCESGLGTQFGGSFFMSFYSWHRDPDIVAAFPDIPKIRARYKKELKGIDWNNKKEVKKNFDDYNAIFWGAHYFCRQTVLGSLQSASMNPTLPGEERYDPGAHSVGNVWKLNGRGDTRIGSTGLW
jgi:hypothetical protein